jgi:RNA polymerase sporulation-specific sigma factor
MEKEGNKYKLNYEEDMMFTKLVKDYEGTIRKIVSKYKIRSSNMDIAMQEGRMGLFNAFYNYNHEKGASFTTFASICIERQIISYIRLENRKKNVVHRNLYPFDYDIIEPLPLNKGVYRNVVEETAINKAYLVSVYLRTMKNMDTKEAKIFQRYVNGYSVSELSQIYKISKPHIYFIIEKTRKTIERELNDF